MNELIQDNLFDAGGIKRADIRLRQKYYGLKTKIYLLKPYQYAIQILNYIELYDQIREDFDYHIRSAGDWVELVKEKPEAFITEVEPLTNIASKNEGIFLTRQMLESLLISRFPNIKIYSIRVEHTHGVTIIITVDEAVPDEETDNIKQFIVDMKNRFTEVKFEKVDSFKKEIYISDVGLACTDKNYGFSVDDAEFWFGNVENIYAGKTRLDDLRFYKSNETKCYMDFSIWDNQNVNIRSNILLYDKIYLSFPLGRHYYQFLEQQKLTIHDLEELVERDKIVILLPNTEQRYNREIVNRLYQINKSSVVSKRGINALMAMFYFDLERKYMSFWKGNENTLESICMELVQSEDVKMKAILQMLLWPIRARTESYELLMSYGPMKLASIGANTLFEKLIDDTERGQDIKFELTVNSDSIHIASALKATYFPFHMSGDEGNYSDFAVAEILGDVINAYQYPFERQTEQLNAYSSLLRKEENALYLLDPNNDIEIKHFLDYSERYKTAHTLKNILQHLVELDADERKAKILKYNNMVAEIGKEKLDPKQTAINYLLTGTGFLPGAGTVASMISLFIQFMNDLKVKEQQIRRNIADNKSSIDEEVYLLDKLSRIARLVPRDLEGGAGMK